jgi:hypothetical protein
MQAVFACLGSAGSALVRLIGGSSGRASGRRASLRQDRLEVFVAVAIEEFLVGTERRDASADFFAEVGARRGGRTGRRGRTGRPSSVVSRRLRIGRFVGGDWLKAGYWLKLTFALRRLCGDGLHKCQGLRDQKVAVLFPFHGVPQPACHFSKTAANDQAARLAEPSIKVDNSAVKLAHTPRTEPALPKIS